MASHRSRAQDPPHGHERPAGAERRGRLKHGNPSGDYAAAPRCGGRARAGHACQQPAMKNGRCRFHGGKSTGPRTAEGRARCRQVNVVHGARTAEMVELRSDAARSSRVLLALSQTANHLLRAQPQSERATPCPAMDEAAARLASMPTDPQSERTTPCPATPVAGESRSGGRLKRAGFPRKCVGMHGRALT